MEGFIIFLYVVCPFLFGFWGMNICDNRGRTPWKGFVAGFIGGIIGIFFCYALDDRRR